MLKLSGGGNLLVEAATPLLVFATHASELAVSTALSKDKLIQHLTHEIKVFEDKAKRAGYSTDIVGAANYSLCALIDEIIVYSTTGHVIQWNGYELLRSFTGEDSEGKNFFVILSAAVENPVPNLDLLELLYLCLTLGFEGKYREQKKGQAVIANLVNELYELIRQYKGEPKDNLLVQSTLPSRFAEGEFVTKKRIHWDRWLLGAMVIVIGLSIYLHWNAQLNEQLSTIDKLLLIG